MSLLSNSKPTFLPNFSNSAFVLLFKFDKAWNNYVSVEKNLETLKRTVEINDEMYKLTLADFQAGNSPIMAVFGMKTAHLMSEVAYQNAQIDWQIARYQLHKVLGLVDPILQ